MKRNLIHTIDSYITNPKKSKWYKPQLFHRHGDEGIDRAKTLKFYLLCTQSSSRVGSFVREFLNRKVTTKSLAKIAIDYYDCNRAVFRHKKMGPPLLDYSGHVWLLNGGRKNPSSLRTYINRVFLMKSRPVNIERGCKSRESIDLSEFPRRRSSVFLTKPNFGLKNDELNITISENDLELIRTLGVSAHPVKMYKKKDRSGKLYFGKDLVSRDQLENYAAEIVYSALWRWFLGDRISASVLLLAQKGGVKGICSEGLKDFKEFKELSKKDVYGRSGLLAIIFYAH
ncbi:MAG: hypothetical protein GY710_24620 [Desulfobacteraceae bacterium]|nr:hypothetical protein [Desulfobacteraceae bacterium]